MMRCCRLLGLTLLLGFLLILPLTAQAGKLTVMYVQPETANGEKAEQAVHMYKMRGGLYYLFLPAGLDATSLQVYFEGPETMTFNGETLLSSQTTGLFQPGAELSMAWNEQNATLRVMQSQNLNALFLTTESGSLEAIHADKEHKEKGTAALLSVQGELVFQKNLDHVKTRGNSSFNYDKKPYQIKFEEKLDLLGMGEAKTWILLSNYIDNSLLRNKIAFELARAVGMEAACRCTYVDLYINHDYAGNYLLTEKMEIGVNRIDIADLEEATEEANDQPLDSYERFGSRSYEKDSRKGWCLPNDPEDITGGYLVEMDLTYRYRNEASGVITSRGQTFVIKSPEYASQAQVDYIGDLLQELEDALFSADGINPNTGKHYDEYIDKDSYVTKFLVEEVLKNYDANRSSQYFYKPVDSQSPLLYAAPPWDFDQALDNYGALGANVFTASSSSTSFHWFPKAYKIPDFREAVEAAYAERFIPALQVLLGEIPARGSLQSIQAYREELKASAQMNFARWGYITYPTRFTRTGENFEESVAYLQSFLVKRMDILAKRWLAD